MSEQRAALTTRSAALPPTSSGETRAAPRDDLIAPSPASTGAETRPFPRAVLATRRATSWYSVGWLIENFGHLVASALAKSDIDGRDWMTPDEPRALCAQVARAAGFPNIDAPSLTQARGGELWLDYVADTGDDADVSRAVAQLVARPYRLPLPEPHAELGPTIDAPRGAVLLFGGDSAYPVATGAQLKLRLVDPWNEALAAADDGVSRALLATPGNHDWNDGLDGFNRLFRRKKIAPMGTKPATQETLALHGYIATQDASYFALPLAPGLTLLAPDRQLDKLDFRQRAYFNALTRDAKTRTVSNADADTDAVTDVNAVTDAHSDVNAEAVTDAHSDVNAVADAVTDAHSDVNAVADAVTDAHSDVNAVADAVADAHSDVNAVADAVTDAHSDVDADAEAVANAAQSWLIAQGDPCFSFGAPNPDGLATRDALGVTHERALLLAGDSHHYVRLDEPHDNAGTTTHLTAGGGGAALHPTVASYGATPRAERLWPSPEECSAAASAVPLRLWTGAAGWLIHVGLAAVYALFFGLAALWAAHSSWQTVPFLILSASLFGAAIDTSGRLFDGQPREPEWRGACALASFALAFVPFGATLALEALVPGVGAGWKLLAAVGVGVLTGPLFVGGLLLWAVRAGVDQTMAYAALGHPGFKHFVRMRVHADGSAIDVWCIGLRNPLAPDEQPVLVDTFRWRARD